MNELLDFEVVEVFGEVFEDGDDTEVLWVSGDVRLGEELGEEDVH